MRKFQIVKIAEQLLAFSGRHHDWDNLLVKMSCFLCSLCFVLGLDSKLVLLLSTDSPLLCHILGW